MPCDDCFYYMDEIDSLKADISRKNQEIEDLKYKLRQIQQIAGCW